jgi:exodeoxyribonuclease-3
MLVVSLNIRHGGRRRVDTISEWIEAQAADVIVLLEWEDNSAGNDIKQRLEKTGLCVATAVAGPAPSNGILVAAREIIISQRITPEGSDKGELLRVDIASNVRLLAAYFPHYRAKTPFFQACMTEALNSNQIPFLFLGDLNTGRNDLDIEGHGSLFHRADLFEALESQAGLIDLWRAEHGIRREWTWRSRLNGFRIDHAFANKRFLDRYPSTRCSYDHRTREIGITDHSALIVTCA